MIWSFAVAVLAIVAIVWGLVRIYHLEQHDKAVSERVAALKEGRR